MSVAYPNIRIVNAISDYSCTIIDVEPSIDPLLELIFSDDVTYVVLRYSNSYEAAHENELRLFAEA